MDSTRTPPPAKRELAFRILGMDCAEEVAILKRAVGPLAGGEDRLAFHLLDGKMTVRDEDGGIREDDVRRAVARAGLRAVPWREVCEAGTCAVEESLWQRKGRAILCVASGTLLALGVAVHALLHGGLGHALVAGETGEPAGVPAAVLVLYLGAIVTGGWFVMPKALAAVRALRPDMNLLMTLAVVGAIVLRQTFEAGSVAFLFSVALLLESWSVGRARRAIRALVDQSPKTARTVCPHDGDLMEKPVAEVPVGAIVVVRPGERVPLDGVVTKGTTHVDHAAITGESRPVAKGPGDEVFAGTINGDGAIEFRSSRAAEDTTFARILDLVEEAQTRRAPAEQWVDRFARVYTPAMIVLAAATAVLPALLLGTPWASSIYRALVVLVIACPCALVISTPVSLVAGLTAAARAGVLIKGGAYLEAVGRLRAFAVDKTGTLTRGEPEAREVLPFSGHSPRDLLACAAALEAHSTHPLARAILRRARDEGVTPPEASDVRALKGKGVEGRIAGRAFWIGSHRLVHERGTEDAAIHDRAAALEAAGYTVVAIGEADHVCGLIAVADAVRPEARAAIDGLRAAGVRRLVLLTGDNRETASAVAAAVGIEEFRAELLPEDKLRAVEELAAARGPVAMVGDGVNDAPAMAAAHVGIAMGAIGSDAAIETADVALMADDLSRLPWLVRHSRRTLAVVRANIGFALGVKAVFLVLAAAGAATLWMAIAADMGASLLVIANGLRLLSPERRSAARSGDPIG
jgi:Cd2+/Zn2+-exporting ATPase